MKNKIIEIISRKGPVVPTDISKELGADSYVVSAVISELIALGHVFYSHKKMSNGPLYYVKGQEDLVRKRLESILNIPEAKILEFFRVNKLFLRDNLEPQQRYMVDELRDFIKPIKLKINGEEKVFYRHYSVSQQDVINKFNDWKNSGNSGFKKSDVQEKINEDLNEKKIEKNDSLNYKNSKKNDEQKKNDDDLNAYEKIDSVSDNFFEKNGFNIIESSVVKKNYEYDFIARQKNQVGQTFFIKYFKKKSISDSDISKAFAVSQAKKMPCIIITKGNISKKAYKVISSLGFLINLIKL